jgi:long-chain acyl-CoA synthetase
MSEPVAELPPGWPALSMADCKAFMTAPGQMFEMEEKTIRGITMRTWKAAPATLKEVFEAGQLQNHRDYIVLDDERVTYHAHRKAALAIAARLQADGVKKGDRVAIVARNIPEWSASFWAAALIGAIITPLNAWWTGAELEYGLTDSGASILIADAERYERLREHLDACKDLKKIYVTRATGEIADPRVAPFESIVGKPNSWKDLPEGSLPDVALDADDDLTIFYTSGTTGKPKGAVGTHRNLISNIFNGMSAQVRSFLRRGEFPPAPDPHGPQRVVLLSVPFFHATGCFAVMVPAMLAGHRIVLQRRFDAEKALELIEREGITHFGGVPTIAWQILEHPRFKEFDTSTIESVSYGGAPSAPELVKRIKESFPKSQPGQGWGMTETSATAVSNGAEDYVRKPSSTGVPAFVMDAKIVTPGTMDELGVNEVGELLVKGPIVVRCYWNKPEASAETFVDGWVRTGDLAKIDEEGFVYIVDRAKDMLIRGGENIYCVEVENALYDHPSVMDAAVVGIAHPTLGEEPGAVVHLKPGMSASEAELRHHVAQRLAAFKVPVKVVFWPETLPRNANGKILKRDLKGAFG